ncbi:TPA: ATP-binding protein, partial [Pasteurella multocida]|nr:ATP-binding protein [Pasteurella multocida]
LHPSLQYEIFYLLKELSQEYGVQVFFTTHSLSLLDLAIKNHANITYLIDEVDSVYPMEKPDIRKIKLFLEKKTQASLYENNKIPLMTEDKEAREFLKLILDYFSHIYNFPEI